MATVEGLLSQSKVVIFTMATCSRSTQGVPYLAVDLDQRGDGQEIQRGLQRLAQQRDVPFVFVDGRLIGGLEKIQQAHRDRTLDKLLSMGQETYDYDLVVIGGEPGGLAVAKEAAAYGKRVLVLDPVAPAPAGTTWGLGGSRGHVTCASRKLMQQAALLGQAVRDSGKFGWEREERVSHNWSDMTETLKRRLGSLRESRDLRDDRVSYLNTSGELVGPHTVKVTDTKGKETCHSAAAFVIATGGRPRYPGIPGDREYCVTGEDLLQLPRCPGRTLVVGGSGAGLECAGFLCDLGLEVTVMVRSVLLPGLDRKMAQKIENHMFVHGVSFLHRFAPTKVEQVQEGGSARLRVTAVSADGTETYEGEFDTVLLAIGRDACTHNIGLDCVGVRYNLKSGKIPVDEEDRTNVRHVFALGEAQEGRWGLRPAAVQAGRLLARRLYAGHSTKCDYTNVPVTVFTPMEYAACGLSEESANHKYGEDNIEVYHSYYWPLEWTLPARDKNSCYAKVICHIPDSERVVGVHVMGPNAGEVIQGFAVAVRCGLTKDQLDATIGIHPVCAEVLTTLTVTQRSSDALAVRGNC
ncbi:thioredoxin reductase 1, cytoplasmic-like [Megalops cyprinoides]|uniref:thioredoxin reductase 1, cytoplasmic-like n=1 Tax=Megalops cyprinoides TaxID=118141 RepID=UPI001864878D|nr:thioredoxin reductase 1, cytoplasmic-like [Megalops cyprinoides]